MKHFKFFYEQIELGELEERIKNLKTFILRIENDPTYACGLFSYDKLVYCSDFSECKFEEYFSGQDFPDGRYMTGRSISASLNFNYNNWLKVILKAQIEYGFEDFEVIQLIDKLKYYRKRFRDSENYEYYMLPLVEDYMSKLCEVAPNLFQKSNFHIPIMSNRTLKSVAKDDLIAIYNFEFKGKKICDSVTIDEWVDFFINEEIPSNLIKLNFNTSIACQAFEYLANKYCISTKKDFFTFIQNSQQVFSNRNTLLTERNITKSANIYNDLTESYLSNLKAFIN